MKNTVITILEHDIKVKFFEPTLLTDNVFGKCSLTSSEIYVDSSLSVDMQNSTVLHEIVHLIADLQSVELTEQMVDSLSLGILSLLRNNKEFIRELSNKQKVTLNGSN